MTWTTTERSESPSDHQEPRSLLLAQVPTKRQLCLPFLLLLAVLAGCGSDGSTATSEPAAAGAIGSTPTTDPSEGAASQPTTPAEAITGESAQITSTVEPTTDSISETGSTPDATLGDSAAAGADPTVEPAGEPEFEGPTRTGAGSLVDQDLAPLHGLRVGLIAHRPSVVDGQPLAVLLNEDPRVELTALFAPEHGLFGSVEAGSSIDDIRDPATGARVFSLYGADRSPTPSALANIDVLVYDLQDVGVRFYTYTSTLGLAMQAAAAADVRFMVLDRPNPIGGDTLQGPSLTPGLESFIGMYNVPSAYGLTSGELATLIKNEGLVPGVADLDLTVIPMQRWSRTMRWDDTGLEWLPPSPNLPTSDSALVYPGTVLFEATTISEGRGTDEPFQLIGAPWIDGDALARELNGRDLPGVSFEAATFTPRSIPGAAESPRFQGDELSGVRIRVTNHMEVAGVCVGLHVLDAALRQAESQGVAASAIIDRPDVFDRLAGNTQVRASLIQGDPVADLLLSFQQDHEAFRSLSADSLLYPTD